MTDLGTLGGTSSTATDINSTGQVVGWSGSNLANDHEYHAFFWEAGTMTDLGTLGGMLSSASAINATGQVVGSSIPALANEELRATLWQRDEACTGATSTVG